MAPLEHFKNRSKHFDNPFGESEAISKTQHLFTLKGLRSSRVVLEELLDFSEGLPTDCYMPLSRATIRILPSLLIEEELNYIEVVGCRRRHSDVGEE